ncbi:MAG: hypothetical protein ACRD17_14750 [Terriglobales bacterium]
MAQGGGWAAVRGISPGSPVEVQLSPHGTAKGAVASVSASGMGVQNSDGSVRQVPKEQIAKVYLLEDSHKLRDALIGAGAGAAGGVALGIAVYNGGACCADYYPTSQQQPHPVSKAVATAVYGAALAAVGAAIGAIIGSRHSKTLVYQRAPGPPTHSQARWGGRRAGTRR